MEYVYEMGALRLYLKEEKKSYAELAERIGVSEATFFRYINGERLPDIDMLVKICNTFRVSIGNFIHHPDVELSSITIYMEEEWYPIKFRNNRIEVMRMEKGMEKMEFIKFIRDKTGVKTALSTYNRLKDGVKCGYELVIAFLNTFDVSLDYLFEDAQLAFMGNQNPSEEILISRQTLLSMKSQMKKLEDDNRRLYTENKRLKRREQARVYTQGDPQEKSDKRMRKFILQAERALDELKSYLPDEILENV